MVEVEKIQRDKRRQALFMAWISYVHNRAKEGDPVNLDGEAAFDVPVYDPAGIGTVTFNRMDDGRMPGVRKSWVRAEGMSIATSDGTPMFTLEVGDAPFKAATAATPKMEVAAPARHERAGAAGAMFGRWLIAFLAFYIGTGRMDHPLSAWDCAVVATLVIAAYVVLGGIVDAKAKADR